MSSGRWKKIKTHMSGIDQQQRNEKIKTLEKEKKTYRK